MDEGFLHALRPKWVNIPRRCIDISASGAISKLKFSARSAEFLFGSTCETLQKQKQRGCDEGSPSGETRDVERRDAGAINPGASAAGQVNRPAYSRTPARFGQPGRSDLHGCFGFNCSDRSL